MITKILLKNFKCFKNETSFEFSKINLLTGVNGRGKSSLLQSMLLLSQSVLRQDILDELIFNGEYVNLGNYTDVKNSTTRRIGEETPIGISIELSEGKTYNLEYYENQDASHRKGFLKKDRPSEDFDNLVSCLKRFRYISADRIGPKRFFEKKDVPNFIHVGAKGELTVNVLGLSQKECPFLISPKLLRGIDSNSLIQQTSEWVDYILDGGEICIKGTEDQSSVLYILLKNRGDSFFNPANMGFGYSYILPLIVTGLISRPGDSIIIENPEAHLHPSAQSRIMEFMSIVASTGVQIFIESHSDHILNALRVCTLKNGIDISTNDVSILFFGSDFSCSKLNVSQKGKINLWPNGFFDQIEKDLSEIFNLSSKLQ